MSGMKQTNRKKTAFVTGVTGQDGSYLVELLLEKGYRVIGAKRRTSTICTDRVDHLFEDENFILEYYDLNDTSRTWQLINQYRPDEIYNLAAMSHVRVSFDIPENTVDGIAMGCGTSGDCCADVLFVFTRRATSRQTNWQLTEPRNTVRMGSRRRCQQNSSSHARDDGRILG